MLRMPAGGIFLDLHRRAWPGWRLRPRAWYLLEPDIDMLERVRRHMSERLHGLNQVAGAYWGSATGRGGP